MRLRKQRPAPTPSQEEVSKPAKPPWQEFLDAEERPNREDRGAQEIDVVNARAVERGVAQADAGFVFRAAQRAKKEWKGGFRDLSRSFMWRSPGEVEQARHHE